MQIKQKHKSTPVIECEWCGMSYPEDPSNPGHPLGYTYLKLNVRNVLVNDRQFKEHIVCKDCVEHLKVI